MYFQVFMMALQARNARKSNLMANTGFSGSNMAGNKAETGLTMADKLSRLKEKNSNQSDRYSQIGTRQPEYEQQWVKPHSGQVLDESKYY